MPALQLGAEFAGPVLGQTVPQAPQLFGSACTFRHAVGAALGHPVNPAWHAKPQVLPLQTGAEFAGPVLGQTVPQAPQLFGSACTFRHAVGVALGHPVKPPLHAKPHAPALHAGFALATVVVHALPQLPQLFESICSLTHAVGAPVGQPERPWSHAQPHVPALHAPIEPMGPPAPVHTLPQLPQLPGLLLGSTQVLPQRRGEVCVHVMHE
jgi:hypothetical protein